MIAFLLDLLTVVGRRRVFPSHEDVAAQDDDVCDDDVFLSRSELFCRDLLPSRQHELGTVFKRGMFLCQQIAWEEMSTRDV